MCSRSPGKFPAMHPVSSSRVRGSGGEVLSFLPTVPADHLHAGFPRCGGSGKWVVMRCSVIGKGSWVER